MLLYPKEKGLNGLEDALDNIIVQIEKALERKTNIIILSDRGVSKDMAPIPALLACSYVSHQMNRYVSVRILISLLNLQNHVSHIILLHYSVMVHLL